MTVGAHSGLSPAPQAQRAAARGTRTVRWQATVRKAAGDSPSRREKQPALTDPSLVPQGSRAPTSGRSRVTKTPSRAGDARKAALAPGRLQ